MADLSEYPEKLREIMEIFDEVDERERVEVLLDYSDRFREVPSSIAVRPFDDEHRVQRCESEAYVFTEGVDDEGNINFHFAVENPQGVSAKALAAILQDSLSGEPVEDILNIPHDLVTRIFGKSISMGKGEGLMGMVSLLKYFAEQEARNQN